MLERTINEITQDATQQSLAAGFDVVGLAPYGTQVAALRAKLGVQRMDDITRLVAELPPMLGALGRQDAQPAAPRGLAGLSASVSSGAGQRQ